MGGGGSWGGRRAGGEAQSVRGNYTFFRGDNVTVLESEDIYIYIFLTLLLCSFWTSRGHGCRPFFPPVLAFDFYRA